MPDHPLKLQELRQILSRFDVEERKDRGKGSHTLFVGQVDEKTLSYTIPTSKVDISAVYVRGIRKKFKLRTQDGVSDEEFYGR